MRGDNVWNLVFVLGFVAIASAETFLPLRSLPSSTRRRWSSNLLLLATCSLAVKFAFQVSAVALAFRLGATSHGALNRTSLPYFARFVIGIAALDLINYVAHRLFHAIALMWRVHQVHHSETDLDLTTGFRFHPLEALASQGLLFVTILLLGPPPAAVAFSALAILVQDYLQHANLRFPELVDRFLRLLIVTPAMHRVHHLERMAEQNSNFGAVFSLWDRAFGTYVAPALPALMDEEVRYGLAELSNGSELHAGKLLYLPFRRNSNQLPQSTNEI